jgi:hypothetical protein
MKKQLLVLALLLTAARLPAALVVSQTFDYSGQPGGGTTIVAGDPVGVAVQGDFEAAAPGQLISGISIGLNLAGGYNGDYYAWLQSPDGTTITLLDQPGSDMFGSPAAGFGNGAANSFVLSSSGIVNIQGVEGTYGSAVTGTYAAAGNLGAFASPSSPSQNGNGMWTLYFDNLGSGGGDGFLKSWTINETILSAPEPPYVVASIVLLAAFVGVARSDRRPPRDEPESE